MKKKEYISQTEGRLKELMSGILEAEAKFLNEISELEKDYRSKRQKLKRRADRLHKQREELEHKFDKVKEAQGGQVTKAIEELDKTIEEVENERETFIDRARTSLDKLNKNIEELQLIAEKRSIEGRKRLEKTIVDMKAKRDEFSLKINELAKDSSGKWQDVKKWFNQRYDSLRASVNEEIKKEN